jgi:hypothetical protein
MLNNRASEADVSVRFVVQMLQAAPKVPMTVINDRIFINITTMWYRKRDGVVGIATRRGLYGPGIEFRWGRGFPHLSRPAVRPTQPPIHWVPGHSRGKAAAGRGVYHHPLSSAEVKERAELYTSTPPHDLRGLLQGEP